MSVSAQFPILRYLDSSFTIRPIRCIWIMEFVGATCRPTYGTGDEVLSSDTCAGMSLHMTSHASGIPEQASYKTLPVYDAASATSESAVSCYTAAGCCC